MEIGFETIVNKHEVNGNLDEFFCLPTIFLLVRMLYSSDTSFNTVINKVEASTFKLIWSVSQSSKHVSCISLWSNRRSKIDFSFEKFSMWTGPCPSREPACCSAKKIRRGELSLGKKARKWSTDLPAAQLPPYICYSYSCKLQFSWSTLILYVHG